MQYIDNDMDELFQKAGSDYPLKTDSADFDKVLAGLHPAPASPKSNYKQYSWLLLLLLLPFGYVLVNNKAGDKGEIHPPAVSDLSEVAKLPFSKGGKQYSGQTNNLNLDEINNSGETNNSNRIEFESSDKKFKLSDKLIAGKSIAGDPYKSPGLVNDISETTAAQSVVSPTGGSTSPTAERGWSSNTNRKLSKVIFFQINNSYHKPVINFPALPVSPVFSNPKKNQKQQTNSFYLGILAGPDFSTVKYQEINNIGYSAGILAGYRFAKRWSVETGFIYDRKKYYTDGQHFDKTNAEIPPSVYVESLDGSCDMFEVPLLLRYDFSENKNRFFAGMGATSYFMKKEKYAYGAYASGTYYEGHRTYDNSGNWLFANVQFSLGYNKQLAPKTNLRIEPYIKVPIKDIGIGNLPITSTGIYFSLTQRIK